MSQVIKQIEAILNLRLHEAPKRDGDPLAALMPFKENYPKYALDEDGNVIGLNLAKTGLTDLKWWAISKIEGLAGHLRALNLSQNELTVFTIPEPQRLEQLNLAENKIREFALPAGIDNLTDLDLEENPMENPGPEIIKQGKAAVLRFLRELITQGVQEVFEVKMLIVGEGETGKTTLWSLLQDPNHPVPNPEQKSTIGIQIKEGWKFKHLDRPEDDFVVNLWDFGGQDIQYMTHQFFLTRRSFYVLLADGRREVANFPYWLKIINLLGCEEEATTPLPVLVVLNEKGNPIARLPYDPESVRSDFPKLDVIKREVDFAKKDGRFDALRATIQDILCHKLAHLPLKFPTNWNAVRLELYQLRETQNHIDSETFERICEAKGVNDKQSRADLSQWLHDLGVILHFHEDPSLADFIILNPQWAANAVYEIMRHQDVLQNQGRFDRRKLRDVWNACNFTNAEQSNLLNLMLKDNFEVCFKATEEGREIYIAPQLLPDQRPKEYAWTTDGAVLRYTYQYPFMPNGIIGRLIVRLHEEIEVRDGRKIVWEKGALLQKDGCRAQIIESLDPSDGRKLIKIEVRGDKLEDRKNILRDIRQELDRIHLRSFPTLKVFQKIPCNCAQCIDDPTPHEYDYSNLKDRQKPTIECPKSSLDIPVRQLLDGVFPAEYALQERKTGNNKPKKIFFSYSKEDQAFLSQLLKHLSALRQNDKIQSWNDADLLPGEVWDARIRQELAEADIILLLVSADFLATPYIQSVEIKTAMERHDRGEAVVIPVILRPCDWESMPFGALAGLPSKAHPVSTFQDRDSAWLQVVAGVKKRIEEFTK
jgi:internalin A